MLGTDLGLAVRRHGLYGSAIEIRSGTIGIDHGRWARAAAIRLHELR